MKTEPEVTVIIPTFNRPKMLANALRSVSIQTVPCKAIVVNDGGTSVADIVAEYEFAMYIEHPDSRGAAAARNTALRAADTEYVAYLDDDDVYLGHHVEALSRRLELGPERVVYSDAFEWDDRTGRTKPLVYRPYSRVNIMLDNITPLITVLHFRSLLEKAGLFDESIGWTSHEDWDFLIRLSQYSDFAHVNSFTCMYRRWSGQVSHDRQRMVAGRDYVQKRYQKERKLCAL